MLRLLSCFVCSSLIILILPSTTRFTYACSAGQISCKTHGIFPDRWCCASTSTCGTTKGSCYSNPGPVPIDSAAGIVAIVGCVLIIVCCIIGCACRSYIKRNTESQNPHGTFVYTTSIPQQHQTHSQSRVAYENPSAYTNEARAIYNHEEKRPPSYESVSRDNRFIHPAAAAAPMRYVPSQESNFRL